MKVKPPPRPSRWRRALQSPLVWACLLLTCVLSSAFLVAYYDATGQATRISQPAPSTTASETTPRASEQTAQVNTSVPASRDNATNAKQLARSSDTSFHRTMASRRALARLDRRTVPRTQLPKSEVARKVERQREPQKNSSDNGPKIASVLKTTWRVLKKPFKIFGE